MFTRSNNTINPETVINLYRNGIFPMGDHNDDNDQIFWCNPIVRAIIPISLPNNRDVDLPKVSMLLRSSDNSWIETSSFNRTPVFEEPVPRVIGLTLLMLPLFIVNLEIKLIEVVEDNEEQCVYNFQLTGSLIWDYKSSHFKKVQFNF